MEPHCVGRTIMNELSFRTTGEVHIMEHQQTLQCHLILMVVHLAVQLLLLQQNLLTFQSVLIQLEEYEFQPFLWYSWIWPSHGVVSTIGVLPNSQSLDIVGIFCRDPSILSTRTTTIKDNGMETSGNNWNSTS